MPPCTWPHSGEQGGSVCRDQTHTEGKNTGVSDCKGDGRPQAKSLASTTHLRWFWRLRSISRPEECGWKQSLLWYLVAEELWVKHLSSSLSFLIWKASTLQGCFRDERMSNRISVHPSCRAQFSASIGIKSFNSLKPLKQAVLWSPFYTGRKWEAEG